MGWNIGRPSAEYQQERSLQREDRAMDKADVAFAYRMEIEERDKAIVQLIKNGQYLYDQMAECAEKETSGMKHWRKSVNVALRFPGVKIT